jgi:glutathione synthase/RimK-type ligase-like ATP-grasp enzyme
MILLCGIPSEAPMRLIVEAAEQAGVEYVLLNQREARYIDICLHVQDGRVDGALSIREQDWPLVAFSGVYVRLMDYQDLPENQGQGRTPPDGCAFRKSEALHQSLIEWLELAECRVANRLSAMGSNVSKPYQAQLINQAGFRTPTTLITNDPEEVRSFFRTHKRVIYKSVSSVRSIVKELDAIKINALHKVRRLPTQFQAFVPGTNVRVHVVGQQVFATEIQSEAVDYRYAGRDDIDVDLVQAQLPPEIEARCVALSQALQLPLCGIDLKRTPDDDYYCFEVNPSPGFSYYQEATGQPIATAIVAYLHGNAGTSS